MLGEQSPSDGSRLGAAMATLPSTDAYDAQASPGHRPPPPPGGHPGVLFILFVMTMIAVNFDSGGTAAVLPYLEKGCLPEFKDEFPCLTQSDQGFLGALPYVGLVVGCPLSGRLLQLHSERFVINIGLAFNVVATFVFGYVIQKWHLFWAKFLIGVSHSAVCVYVPVWVDFFAPESRRNTWLGLVQGLGAMGAMVGYAVAGYFTSLGLFYQYAFRLQACWIIGCVILLTVVPTRTINVSAHKPPRRGGTELKTPEARSSVGRSLSFSMGTPELSSMAHFSSRSHDDEGARGLSEGAIEGTASQLRALLKNSTFMSTAFGLCCLFFVVTAVQFWATLYFDKCFRRPPIEVTSVFLFVSSTAPMIGVCVGGAVVDRKCQKNMLATANLVRCWAVVAVIAAICAAVVPLYPYDKPHDILFIVEVLCIWLVLFFGAMMLPPCTGVILQSVSEHQKPMANACSMFLYNTFGYALGAALPGQIAYFAGLWGVLERKSLHLAMQVVFVMGAGCGLVCMLLMYASIKRREPAVGRELVA